MNALMSDPSKTSFQSNSGNTIELRLQDIEQFFNTMDPSPFHEKDLDHDAEEFIVSWAREYPLEAPLRLIVHLHSPNGCGDSVEIVERAVHNYFRHRAELSRRELRQLFRAGRISLVNRPFIFGDMPEWR